MHPNVKRNYLNTILPRETQGFHQCLKEMALAIYMTGLHIIVYMFNALPGKQVSHIWNRIFNIIKNKDKVTIISCRQMVQNSYHLDPSLTALV